MKIINSHYIPLPEPRWLIVDSKGTIYEQLGTMTIVADASKEKGEGGIKTYAHPVVAQWCHVPVPRHTSKYLNS